MAPRYVNVYDTNNDLKDLANFLLHDDPSATSNIGEGGDVLNAELENAKKC